MIWAKANAHPGLEPVPVPTEFIPYPGRFLYGAAPLPPRLSQHLAYTARSAAETRALARALAAHLEAGDLLCLIGDLGAGKTTFVQGLAEGLGAAERATSPSFVLVHQYRGRLPLYHLDLYRATGDLTEIGLDDIIGGDAAVAVEWAERLPGTLCADALQIRFDFDASRPSARRITLRATGPRGQRVLERLGKGKRAHSGH